MIKEGLSLLVANLPKEYLPDSIIEYRFRPEKKLIPVSTQAKALIKEMPNFDMNKFLDWYCKGLQIGSKNILEYIMHKKK